MRALNDAITPLMIENMNRILAQNLGWSIDIDDPSFESKMGRIVHELGCKELKECILYIQSHPSDKKVVQALAREFSVNESYFFRDTAFLDHLERDILPKIVQRKEKRLNIWSVGCSRGEEAYSIAMVLHRNIPDIQNWALTILATDVNVDVLEQGISGLYSKWSLRCIPEYYKNNYLISAGELYEIHPSIRKMVKFQYHNIAAEVESCVPGNGNKYDLILFENVLIYLEDNQAKEIVRKLFGMVEEGGCFVTTAVEYNIGMFDFPHVKCTAEAWVMQKPYSTDPLSILEVSKSAVSEDLFEIRGEDDPYDVMLQSFDQKNKPNAISEISVVKNKHHLYYRNAIQLLESGDVEGAKESLHLSLYSDSKFIVAYILLGDIYKKEGNDGASTKCILTAKKLLQEMEPKQEVMLADGVTASNLLGMLNAIKGEHIGK